MLFPAFLFMGDQSDQQIDGFVGGYCEGYNVGPSVW
jgi:hypothetical protein